MDLISIVMLVLMSIGLVAYSVWPKSADNRDAVKRRLEGRRSVDELAEIKEKARKTATEQIVKKATPMLSKLIMPMSEADTTQLRAKLIQAGYRAKGAQTVFLASKTALLVVFGIAGVSICAGMGYDIRGIAGAGALGAGLGFMLPGLWLGSVTKGRQERVRRGLPDVLDLLVVSVESGLALDAGIKRVGEEMALVHPDVSEEFRISTRESQMGLPRSEALDNMSTRCGVDEMRAMVSVILQAERFGTSISKALRNQGESMRSKRRLKAEEAAQKTAVKLMIPLVLFIFPALGIVLAGPAAIRLMEAFGGK
ncbi:MAG: type II secretion system F family protein [Phycisphaerae bacterium]